MKLFLLAMKSNSTTYFQFELHISCHPKANWFILYSSNVIGMYKGPTIKIILLKILPELALLLGLSFPFSCWKEDARNSSIFWEN